MARVFTITEGLENMGAMKTGGQGSVYKGKRMGEIFTAIKILPTPIHSEDNSDKNFVAFQNEVQKLKKVNEQSSPNVVKIVSSGITDSGNLPFIEMEFIEGPDLEELIKPPHEPVFTIKETIKVAEQLANALAHCHRFDVKHGDIKSNNVKFNSQTGNYLLLDFGLAIMSDEQRRSSLRQAGAIEFMAPEQNEGQMLFETDVYSFGVVLYELIAGTVPFPLNDKGETARNLVMVAHMEKDPPDLMQARLQHLPVYWDEKKKQAEMQLPSWLVSMVYKCLQKKPSDRFADGRQLHQFIATNSVQPFQNELLPSNVTLLQQEVNNLTRENELLRKEILQYKRGTVLVENKPAVTEWKQSTTPQPTPLPPVKKESSALSIILALLFTGVVIAGLYYFFLRKDNTTKPISSSEIAATDSTGQRRVVGEYIVTAAKAYFYNEPDEKTRRNAYAIASSEIIKALDDREGYVYAEITNDRGQVSKGWLRKDDMITLAEWQTNNRNSKPPGRVLSEEEISLKLNEATLLLNSNKVAQAISLYKELSAASVPDATYQYAVLALQNRHNQISCNDAFNSLKKLSNEGYVPAKRSLGFLYSFADDDPMLLQYSFDRCNFVKDVSKGSKLLMEAMLTGDTAARRLLDDLNAKTLLDKQAAGDAEQ